MTPAKPRSRKPAGKALASLSQMLAGGLRHAYVIFFSRAKQFEFGSSHTQSNFTLS
jgi:hypothetical protein